MPPVANYVPFVNLEGLVYISGQLPIGEGNNTIIGKIGHDLSLEEGQQAARLCTLNLLAHLKKACDGNLDRLEKCVRLGGFVNCVDAFTDHPKVMNGASDLIVELFGEKGHHARAVVGVSSLPLGCAIEIEGLFKIK